MILYTRDELKACAVYFRPSTSVLDSIRVLRINRRCRHRGRRAGRRRSKFVLERAVNGYGKYVFDRLNGKYVFTVHSRPSLPPRTLPPRVVSLRRIKRLRDFPPTADELTFGFLNVRYLTHKLDDLLEVCADLKIRVICLCETWHDPESA